MEVNASKNQELIKLYPFVYYVLDQWMEPYASWNNSAVNAKQVDDLTIHVKKADGDLMFRRADNVGLGDNACILELSKKRRDQVMRRGEYLFAIGSKLRIINRVDWPRNNEKAKKTGDVYGWSVLWSEHCKDKYSNPIWDKVRYLVWVTVQAWHKDSKNYDTPGRRFGKFCDRSMHITIYEEPDCGFEKLQEQSCFEENLYLNSKVITRAVFRKNLDILIISGRLDELCRLFQDEVYFNGMKDVLDNGECRGASGQFGYVEILCAEMCGYDRVMLKDEMSWITFQLRPGSKIMYVLGMDGTLPKLRNLVKTVVKMWSEPELRSAFKPDKQVSVI